MISELRMDLHTIVESLAGNPGLLEESSQTFRETVAAAITRWIDQQRTGCIGEDVRFTGCLGTLRALERLRSFCYLGVNAQPRLPPALE